MAKFKIKPVVIEAFQFGADNIPEWFSETMKKGLVFLQQGNDIKEAKDFFTEFLTTKGVKRAELYDIIIQGTEGDIYVCKPEVFKDTYELVED
jgi:hypothetical protein